MSIRGQQGRVVAALVAAWWLAAGGALRGDIHGVPNREAQLFGKYVVFGAGHGADAAGGWDRPVTEGLREDIHLNEIFIVWLQRYLANAGMTTFALRERTFQESEVIVDNSTTGYAETGSWSSSSSSVVGRQFGTNYRIASSTGAAPHATATWTPNLPADGKYPVYVYLAKISSRNPTATYTVRHPGGVTTVTIDQRLHGDQFVYLGTWYFLAGQDTARGSVSVSSQGTGTYTHADAVRFGGGIDSGNGYARWKSDGRRFLNHIGYPSTLDNVSIRPAYASWLRGGVWSNDWRFLEMHTNAGGSKGVSTFSYVNGRTPAWGETGPVTYTADQQAANDAFATALLRQFMTDMRGVVSWPANTAAVAGAPVWNSGAEAFKNWAGYTTGLLMNFGALRTNAAMPNCLVELVFHDHLDDIALLRSDRWRHAAARSMYKSIARQFNPAAVIVPLPPGQVRATQGSGGNYTLAWSAVADPMEATATATGFKIYRSADGKAWDNGTAVGNVTQAALSATPGQLVFLRVAATNAGGESLPSPVVAVRPAATAGAQKVLLVAGFDRDFTYRVTEVDGNNDPTNSLQRYGDDAVAGPAAALAAYTAAELALDTATNETVESGLVNLAGYRAVVWLLGEESTADETFSAAEQARVETYLTDNSTANRRRSLLVSGAEIGWDLDRTTGPTTADRQFYNNRLRADYAADDAGTYGVAGVAGGPFAAVGNLTFSNGQSGVEGDYDVAYPDVLTPLNGANGVLRYDAGTYSSGNYFAGVAHFDGSLTRVLNFGFPVERVTGAGQGTLLRAAMEYLLEDSEATPPPAVTGFSPTSGPAGTWVDVDGTHLSGATAVRFNGVSATEFTVTSATRVRARVPAGAASGPVSVVTPAGTGTSSATFTVPATPVVSSLTPGSAAPGGTVTATGSGFTGVTAVLVGGVPVESFTVLSTTQIRLVLPLNAATGAVTVVTAGGQGVSSATLVVSAPPSVFGFTPMEGPAGTQVAIDGQNLLGATAVSFHGTAASSFQVASADRILAIVPTGATAGPIAVETALGRAVTFHAFTPAARAPGGASEPDFSTSGAGVAIPDNNATGVTSTVTVSRGGTLQTLWVSLAITHTYIGDLLVTLRSPAGTMVTLHDRAGGDTDNLQWVRQKVDGFAGENPQGSWTLTVSDRAAADTGSVVSWSLETAVSGAGPAGLTASDGLFGDRVELAWQGLSGADAYRVYRGTTASAAGSTLLVTTGSNQFADTTALPGTIYYYWVTGANPVGESARAGPETGYRANQPPVIAQGDSVSVTMDRNGSPRPFALTLNATDPEGQALTWTIAVAARNGTAAISGSGASRAPTYTPASGFTGADSFVVAVTDAAGGVDRIAVNVAVVLVNSDPTNLTLSGTSLREHLPPGTGVGTLGVTDVDANDTHTFSLVSGTGSTDNGYFQVAGNQLLLRAALDRAVKTAYALRLRVTDAAGSFFEKAFTVTATPVYEETVEAGSGAGWTFDAPNGQDAWMVSAVGYQSTYAFVTLAKLNRSDSRLVSPAVAVTAGAMGIVLSFDHVFDFEEKDATRAWDGGVLEVSFDNGTTWADVAASGGWFLQGAYAHLTNSPTTTNPLGIDRACWSNASGGWKPVEVAFDGPVVAGKSVRFRWRFASDGATASNGWVVDNVRVRTVATTDAPPNALFFSEYIEPGSTDSDNKVLEIYNGTGRSVNLGTEAYTLELHTFTDAGATNIQTWNLTGTVADNQVFVVANAAANHATVLAQVDMTLPAANFLYNGDDTLILKKGGAVVDVIGRRGSDPGVEWGSGLASTNDNTLRRQGWVSRGDTVDNDAFDPAAEWVGYPVSTYNGLGSHTCVNRAVAPVWATANAAAVAAGAAWSYPLAATDGNFNDTLALAGTGLPSWVTLTDLGGGAGRLSGTPPAAPLGAASFTLRATDGNGLQASQTFTVTVTAPAPVGGSNAAPVVSGLARTVSEDQSLALSAALFQGAFSDADAGAVLRWVRIETAPARGSLWLDGAVVPAGRLLLPGELDRLVYRPEANFAGTDGFAWNASDGLAYAGAAAQFTLSVQAVNDAPTVGALSVHLFEDETFGFLTGDFSAVFADPEGTSLSAVQITQLPVFGVLRLSGLAVALNQTIPAGSLGQLVYTPGTHFAGSDQFRWTGSDGVWLAAADAPAWITAFALPDAPALQQTPANATGAAGDTLTVQLPVQIFADPDGETLTYAANLADGSALPSWLTFHPATLSFSGKPLANAGGTYAVRVRATDGTGRTGETVFQITISVPPQRVAREIEEANNLPEGSLAGEPTSDFDGDGVPELLEIALGAGSEGGPDPTRVDPEKMPQVKVENGEVVMEYRHNTALEGVSYFKVQVSTDMVTWVDIDDPNAPSGFYDEQTGMDEGQVANRRAGMPIASGQPLFFRIVLRTTE